MASTKYFMFGAFLVKFLPTTDGGLAVLELDVATGRFVVNLDRYFEIIEARDGVQRLNQDQFIQRVEALRSRVVTEESAAGAVYQVMVGIEDVAKEEGRPLRPDEEGLLAELRRQTYAQFEADHPAGLGELEQIP